MEKFEEQKGRRSDPNASPPVFVQEQPRPFSWTVGASAQKLKADFIKEQSLLNESNANLIIFEARRKMKGIEEEEEDAGEMNVDINDKLEVIPPLSSNPDVHHERKENSTTSSKRKRDSEGSDDERSGKVSRSEKYEFGKRGEGIECGAGLRIATYNVHGWYGVDGTKLMRNRMLQNIKLIDPDVICLNESLMADAEEDRGESLINLFKEIGFEFSSLQFATKPSSHLMNAVFSKVPLLEGKYHQLPSVDSIDDPRLAIELLLAPRELGSVPLRIFATHLDVFDPTERMRVRELQQILRLSHARGRLGKTSSVDSVVGGGGGGGGGGGSGHGRPPHSQAKELHVILGDFNALRRADYDDERWHYLERHDQCRGAKLRHDATDMIEEAGFLDSFAINEADSPLSTTWSARRVDYIYLSDNFKAEDCPVRVMGSYVFHDAASDHLPVILDLVRCDSSRHFVALPNDD